MLFFNLNQTIRIEPTLNMARRPLINYSLDALFYITFSSFPVLSLTKFEITIRVSSTYLPLPRYPKTSPALASLVSLNLVKMLLFPTILLFYLSASTLLRLSFNIYMAFPVLLENSVNTLFRPSTSLDASRSLVLTSTGKFLW